MNANRFAHLLFPVIRTLVALALVFQASGTALAAVWTDQADYTPGSVVTISGDNRDNVGYLGMTNREKKALLTEWVRAVRTAAGTA